MKRTGIFSEQPELKKSRVNLVTMGMRLKWKRVSIITIPIVLTIVMMTVITTYVMNPAQVYNSLTSTYTFNVIANFSDGGINQTMMQEMIRNTANSALNGFIMLNKLPYPIINVKPFENTLITHTRYLRSRPFGVGVFIFG